MAQRKGFTVKNTPTPHENRPIFGERCSVFIRTCRPLVGVAVTGFLTVLIGFYRPETLPALTVVFTAVLLLSLFFRRIRRLVLPLLMILLISVSCLVTVGHIRRLQPLDRQTATVTFTVTEEPYHSGVGKRMPVRVAESRLFEGFKANVWYRQGDFKVGGRYRAEITFYSVEQNEYRMSNYGNGTFLNGVLHSAAKKTGESRPLVLAGRVRHYVRQTLTRRFSTSQAATLCALTVGDRSDFSDGFYNAVRDAGVSHVMVVSGLHLGIVFGGLFHLLQKFTKNRTVQAVVALFGVLFFMAVCGFTMSIIRAGITYLIAAAAPLFKRDYDPVTALAATVCGVTAISPFTALNVAFQLSVTATFAILVVAPFFTDLCTARLPEKLRLILYPVLFLLFGSIAAMITTLPVVVAAFGTLSLIAPLTNLLISFAVSVALTSTVLALALFPVPIFRYAAAPLFWVAGLLTRYINRVILWCGGANLTVYIPKSAFIFTFLPIITVLCVILGCNRRKYLLKLKKLENERSGSNGRAVRGCR